VYGFGAKNVESSRRNNASFLQWMRQMIQIRREHPIFGLGGLVLLQDSNSAVLAYLRTPAEARQRPILCVANFSAAAQPVELGLHDYAGRRPVELTGGVEFPRIGDLPYLLTLPPFGFLSFELFEDSDR
jgi:maltose alpha-D-glucosyltransferase/alpha-amylase